MDKGKRVIELVNAKGYNIGDTVPVIDFGEGVFTTPTPVTVDYYGTKVVMLDGLSKTVGHGCNGWDGYESAERPIRLRGIITGLQEQLRSVIRSGVYGKHMIGVEFVDLSETPEQKEIREIEVEQRKLADRLAKLKGGKK